MRVKVFEVTILVLFGVIILGLFYTQVSKYDMYKDLSEKNRIRVLPLEAPRGKIYDRNGNILVSNRISFDVEVVFQEIKDKKEIIDILSGILGIGKTTLSAKIDQARQRPFVPVKIVEDIEKSKAIQIEEVRLDLPGVIVTTRPLRNYIYNDIFSPAIGHLGMISESELMKYRTYGYRIQDFVGKDGVERSYNDYLRGVGGGLQTEVDSRGRQLRVLAIKEPHPGRDLYLSVDLELQKFCDDILSGKKGAIVVMDPSTGAILALANHANYDPNIFVSPNNSKAVSNLLSDSRAFPMLNRAISGVYPPGSVFKIVVAAAALESGSFNAEKTFLCNGEYSVGNRIFRCWKEEGHGSQNITEGIKNSCNVFFYQLGLFVGPEEISRFAFRLGMGKPTGIDLPGEAAGFVPTVSWKKKRLKAPWFNGETANYAIGQGYLSTTPIQILRLAGIIASGGKLVQPFIVDKIGDTNPLSGAGNEVKLRHDEPQDIGLKAATIETIKEGLRKVVNASRGTGFYARSDEVIVSGKTGTAQNPSGAPHAWFVGFAPFKDPRICVVVFIEHGGKGGLEPARFARKIIEKAKALELL